MTTEEKIAQNNGFLLGLVSKGLAFSLSGDYKHAMQEIAEALRDKMYEVTADTLDAIMYTINNMDLAPIIYARIRDYITDFTITDSNLCSAYGSIEHNNDDTLTDFVLSDIASVTII